MLVVNHLDVLQEVGEEGKKKAKQIEDANDIAKEEGVKTLRYDINKINNKFSAESVAIDMLEKLIAALSKEHAN